MDSFLNGLEYFMSLQYLVDFGNFYAAKCADVGGEWIRNADNSYECIDTIWQQKLETWVNGLLNSR